MDKIDLQKLEESNGNLVENMMAYTEPAIRLLGGIVTNEKDIRIVGEGIDCLQNLCHGLSARSGWWDGVDKTDKNVIGTKLALIHSEISEALEGVRKDCPDTHLTHRSMVEVELADAVIRIMDLVGAMKLDLAGAIIEKLAYNKTRQDHKRENRAAAGGKAI